MKRHQLLITLFIFCLLTGCKKENTGTAPVVTLVAKWDLVSDYTSNHLAQMNTYIGVAGDYFDFRADGKCYIKEGSLYDTLSYAIKNDTTITISPFGHGNPLTVHSATLTSAGPYPPGEVDYRQVKLAR